MSYSPKASAVAQRALKVQRLVIPLTVSANATPASKVVANDEPAVLFINAQGVTQITAAKGALDSGEATPTFDLALADATGDLNMLVKISEPVSKVLSARVVDRATGASYACYTNTSAAPLSANGDKMLLNCHTNISLATTALNACLVVEYVVA